MLAAGGDGRIVFWFYRGAGPSHEPRRFRRSCAPTRVYPLPFIISALDPGRTGLRPGAGNPVPACAEIAVRALHRADSDLQERTGHVHAADFIYIKEAQAFFDQGFQMMYAFAKPEAVRSFREAWKRDPDCAICYWGEAWAWGSYLNGPMTPEEAPHAYAAIQKAIALKANRPKERALIEAMSVRYVESFDAAKRVEQDRAYRDAMGRVAARIRTILTSPRFTRTAVPAGAAARHARHQRAQRPASSPRARGDPGEKRSSSGRLPPLRARHRIDGRPGRAEACAAFLGKSIPGASHINHMPSHTWNEVGRWGDSVRANIEAWHSDLKATIGEGFAIYPEHNLHMLLYAASMDGQGAVAIQAGKDTRN